MDQPLPRRCPLARTPRPKEAVFLEAARDYRFLLGRGYPRAGSLALVGDRHGLDAQARQLLRRGVFAPAVAQARRARLLGLADVAGRNVAVDGHNALITLESALKGAPLVLGDDGVIRDTAGAGANHRPSEATLAAARLLLAALRPAVTVTLLLDAPLSQSGELAGRLRTLMAETGIAGQARAVPERELAAHQGPVATSDSQLLDAVAQPLDLAGAIIMTMDPAPALARLE